MSAMSPALVKALRGVEAHPGRPEAWLQLGAAFLEAGNPTSAVEACEQATRLAPRASVAWQHLGLARRKARQHHQGRLDLECAVALAPHDPQAWGNYSAALESCGDARGAAEAALRACTLDPTNGGWWAARGNALRSAGNPDAALAAYDEADRRSPGDVRVAWNRALTLLSAHDFQRGLPAYEVRRQRPQHARLPAPVWDSGPPPSSGVLVHHEQGYGDTLQWARFLPRLAQHTAKVVVAAPKRLCALLRTVPGVHGVIDREEAQARGILERRGCGAHVGLMSLGARLGETGTSLTDGLPAFVPDSARVERFRTELAGPGPLVAITWQGNPAYERDHLRSPPLSAFSPVVQTPGVRFVSLQKFDGLDQLTSAGAPLDRIENLGARIDLGKDAFLDTAAVMSVADLIITSDTSTAHLAGALARPTWVVLSRPADWRWGNHPSGTPWYPSMRLFRQPTPGDWPSVFSEVAAALDTWIAEPLASTPTESTESP